RVAPEHERARRRGRSSDCCLLPGRWARGRPSRVRERRRVTARGARNRQRARSQERAPGAAASARAARARLRARRERRSAARTLVPRARARRAGAARRSGRALEAHGRTRGCRARLEEPARCGAGGCWQGAARVIDRRTLLGAAISVSALALLGSAPTEPKSYLHRAALLLAGARRESDL